MGKLTPKEIVDSLRRLDIRIDSPTVALSMGATRRSQRAASGESGHPAGKLRKTRTDFQVKLPDIIAAGLLKPPVKLFRKYRGQRMEAVLLADGRVDFSRTV